MKKLVLFIIPFLAIGCKTIEKVVEVPVEVIKTEYETQYIHDSTYIHDSAFMYINGDTIFKNVYKYIYSEKTVHDTLIKNDSIEKPVYIHDTVVKTVNKPQWWPVWLTLGIVLLYYTITKTTFIEKLKIFIKYLIKLFK